ncbi:Acetylglutamate kinase [Vigna angularis]|uniref:Acetylglutamate kinase n=1 Tax=Phaseolus angularis TaxID=3914 RepID=A0A8T0JVW0_PHAAN|nr:Acetylglutamate kinase [Vigna angularis]
MLKPSQDIFPSSPFLNQSPNSLTTPSSNPSFPSSRLRHHHAIYIVKFRGKTIVVKYGGATMNKAGATAGGFSSLHGCILTARPNPKTADLGFVGEVARVDPAVLRSFIAPATF